MFFFRTRRRKFWHPWWNVPPKVRDFSAEKQKCWNCFRQFYAKMFFWIRGMQFWWSFRILFCQKPENHQMKVRKWCKKNSSFEENLVLSKISSFTRRKQLFIPGKKFSPKVRKVFAGSPRKEKLIYTSEIKFLQRYFWTRRFEFWQSSLKCSTVNPIIFAWSPWMKFVKTDSKQKILPKPSFALVESIVDKSAEWNFPQKVQFFFVWSPGKTKKHIFSRKIFLWNSSSGYVELSYEGSTEHFCAKFRNFVSKVRKRFQWRFTSNFCSLRIFGGHVEGMLVNRSNNFRENSEIFLLRIGKWPTINLFSSTI